MQDIDRICLGEGTLLKTAIDVMTRSGRQIVLIVDADKKLLGTFTDGDLRRALLSGATLESPLKDLYNDHPLVVPAAKGRVGAVEKMRAHGLDQMPLVDERGRVTAIESINPAQYGIKLDNRVVIMAGGLGKRLHPVTKDIPKALVPIGERPILEIVLERLTTQGFQNFTLAINHFGHMIEDYFKDGSRWNVSISYIREEERLGTAGALGLLPERPSKPILVMNCDVLTTTDFQSMLDFHDTTRSTISMGIRENSYVIPYGVVETDGSRFVSLQEKPEQRYFINTGIYVLSPEAIDYIPRNSFFDMTTLVEKVSGAGKRVSCYAIKKYWIDIGQPHDLDRARTEYHQHF